MRGLGRLPQRVNRKSKIARRLPNSRRPGWPMPLHWPPPLPLRSLMPSLPKRLLRQSLPHLKRRPRSRQNQLLPLLPRLPSQPSGPQRQAQLKLPQQRRHRLHGRCLLSPRRVRPCRPRAGRSARRRAVPRKLVVVMTGRAMTVTGPPVRLRRRLRRRVPMNGPAVLHRHQVRRHSCRARQAARAISNCRVTAGP